MKITCIGHSGFAVEMQRCTLIFDYYTDQKAVLPDVLGRAQCIYAMVSHSHRDHLNYSIFDWNSRYPAVHYVIANECRRKLLRHIAVDQLPITFMSRDRDWADGNVAVHAFGSTDVGVSFLVEVDGKRIFHAGDFNCWINEQEDDEAIRRKALGDFHAVLADIRRHVQQVDVALFPVIPNMGGDFARGAREFLQAVKCDVFIPMHMWGRDTEATQFQLYQNPDYGKCLHVPTGTCSTL